MPPKRKRSDRPSADGSRPSPHRPGDTVFGQHDRDDGGGRGRGRGPRGGGQRHDSSQGHGRRPPVQSPTSRRASNSSQPVPQSAPPPSTPKNPVDSIIARPSSTVRLNYTYDNLTDDRVHAWAERGRQEVLQHGVQSREDVDITELSSLFQEFIYAVVEGRLDPTDAGSCVNEIMGDETSEMIKDSYAFAPHTLLLDSFALVLDNDPSLYRPALRDFLIATGVSPNLMRETLDETILPQLGLVRETFRRAGVKQATNLLYRQANYNLLREETEGYSKLITDLYTISSSVSPPPEVAEQTFERIKALIGTFDLDVGRALDVTLDVAASVVVKQVKFFVRLLRVSSWWPRPQINVQSAIYPDGVPNWARPGYPHWTTTEEDDETNLQRKLARDIAFWERAREVHLAAFFELGGRQITDSQALNGKESDGNPGDLTQQWMNETGTLPPPGNRVAAQLLGFKLRFYYSDYRSDNDVLPANLLYLVAVLCKIGFISLPDIYPHLSPSDDDMEQVREDQLKILEQEDQAAKGGPMNALAKAGVLPDADDDGPRRPEPAKKTDAPAAPAESAEDKKKKKPLEQKVSLLLQLLTIGAIPEALFLLGRFPWIIETHPEALQRIHRLLHVSLEKLYRKSQPSRATTMECHSKGLPDHDQTGMPKGSLRLTKPPPKKTNPWPYPDAVNTKDNSNSSWRYFWDEWADNVPVCETVDDVFTLCNTFLNVSGVNIGKDESLLAKLASIGAKSLAEDKSSNNLTRWHDLLKRLLVPALSHTHANASVVNAIWDLLRHYPTTTRYAIYAEWFEGQISRLPAMSAAFARARTETRGTMKRISLTTLSEMAKKMAKTSYSSPGIVFKVALEQLESYPNLIEAFVECAKYFTDLSYDVLVWSLLSSLGKSRSRTQAEHALTTSKWLQALSRFSGKVFRRYSVLDPTPVLSYVNAQLFKGNSTDLIILKEFIASMGGIVDSSDFTDYQVLSMAGGEYLRRHTLIRGQDKRFENIKSSRRLIQALKDANLAARLLINLTQYRQAAIFQVPEDEAHIKYLSSLIDDTHQTLLQYLGFLWSNLDAAGFDAIVPSITELMTTYGLDASLAFIIGRSSLAHRMFPWKAKKDEVKDKTPASVAEADKDGDVSMADSKTPNGIVETPMQDAAAGDDQVGDLHPQAREPPTNPNRSQKPDDPSQIRSALQPIVDTLQETMPQEIWQKITPELFVTFWALQLGDLFCPDKMYRQERERLKSEELAVARDRSDMTRRGQEKKMEKRKELMQLQIGLSEECGEHLLRQAKWKFNLSKQFQTSFPNPDNKADSISDVLLEQCFLPRIVLSTADAEYTYRFIKALHDWNAPSFKLMSLYDRFFNANRLRSLIFTCTVREAEYFGRFMKLLLEDLSRWHKNEFVPNEKDSKTAKDQPRLGVYEKEGKGPSDQPRLGFALTFDDDGKPATFVEHAQFKDLLFRWHKNLNMALKSCLAGTEWMHIRNAITVLRAIMDFFPAVDFMANQFSAQLQKITQQEAASKTAVEGEEAHRVDLSVAAQGAMSELQKRKSKWVMVQAFRPNTVGGSQAEADKSAASTLRATAVEFKPQPGNPGGKVASTEEEDGEVQDSKDATSRTIEVVAQQSPLPSKESLPAKPSAPNRELPRRGETPTGTSTPGRSSTPKPGQGAGPNGTRAEPGRPGTLPARPPPGLPSKPDLAAPSHLNSERFPSRGPERRDSQGPRDSRDTREPHMRDNRDRDPRFSRDPRDVRDPKDARDSRLPDPERAREHPDRRVGEGGRDATRAELPPRPGTGDRNDRPQREPRGRPHERQDELTTQSPATRPAPSDAEEPQMNPERAALFAQDAPVPPRGNEMDRSGRGRRPGPYEPGDFNKPDVGDRANDTPSRGPRDGGRERGLRGHSPRRSGRFGQENGPVEPVRDDRPPRPYAPELRGPGRDPRDRSPAPGGFRGDRPIEHPDRLGTDSRAREPSGFHGPSPRGLDPEHRPPYQDQNYGRLNPISSPSEIPSGPRSRGRGAARGGHGPPPPPSGRDGRLVGPDGPRATSPERQPPTGPASGRGRRGGFESGAGPATPSGGPHPDRMRTFGSGQEHQTPSTANATPVGVHPDRLAQMGGPGAPPTGPQHGPGRHAAPDQPEPSGPASGSHPHPAAAGPGPAAETPVPTGPADRTGRGGGGRRQIAGINSTLQQAQANMPDMGRSSSMPRRNQQQRQMLGNSDAQVLTGGSPVQTPSNERPDPMRTDDGNRPPPPPANGDDGQGRSEHGHGRRDRDSHTDRSNRSSRRSSRERDRSQGHDRDSKEHREFRDRRSGAGPEGGGREERDPRRPPRDGAGREPMGPPAGGRDLMPSRDGRHRGHAPGARDEEWTGGSGGSMRGPSRGGPRNQALHPEERRDSRDDRGRKRKSDEGMGGAENEREKRQRR